jgi:hypothetical protein
MQIHHIPPDSPRADLAALPFAPGPRRIFRLLPLLLLAAALLATNARFTVIDDEVLMLDAAAQPAGQMALDYWRGAPVHEHPPLFDLLLHGWIRLTHGSWPLLRLPSIAFYVAGLWILSLAAEELGGSLAASLLLWLGLLWPFGFHFGRIVAWYSFAFFLTALATFLYLRILAAASFRRWLALVVAALALVYANYFGWALLACLAVDYLLHCRRQGLRHGRAILATAALLLLAYFPLWRAFLFELRAGIGLRDSPLAAIFFSGFNFYALFVSESVGPWAWWLSVPACLVIAGLVFAVLLYSPWTARRFLIYFFVLFLAMSLLGILSTKRTMFLAAWLLFPMAVTLALAKRNLLRCFLVAGIAIVFGIGWYGIFVRRYYAAPRFIEPWADVAASVAPEVAAGAEVITNSPSFSFYLTRALPPWSGAGFSGVLTYSLSRLGVYGDTEWDNAGRPLRTFVFLVEGVRPGPPDGPLAQAELLLEQNCRLQRDERLLRDPGFALKQRFFPRFDQVPWRVHLQEFSCGAASSSPRN